MRKVLILCTIIALAFGASGASCLKNVQTQACNPPAEVMATATTALQVIQYVLPLLIPGTAAYLAAVNASAVANSIQVGICVSVTQLNALIAFLQSDTVKMAEAKMMVKAGPARAAVLNIQPLLDWQKSFK